MMTSSRSPHGEIFHEASTTGRRPRGRAERGALETPREAGGDVVQPLGVPDPRQRAGRGTRASPASGLVPGAESLAVTSSPPPALTFEGIHKNLRLCERYLRELHPACALVPDGPVACVCGRSFVHVCEPGGCYWGLRG